MKRDIVEVYNHLFDETLDGALYTKILDKHYFKFSEFYHAIKNIDMESISNILYNSDNENCLELIINFNTEDIITDFIKSLDNIASELNVSFKQLDDTTSFNILIKSEVEEVKIYGHRFNSIGQIH